MRSHFSAYGTSRKFIEWARSHGVEFTESTVSRAQTGVGSNWTWLVFKIYLDEIENNSTTSTTTKK